MTKYIYALFSFLFFAAINVNGQERIATDRPDQTELATLTPLHYFQAEFGFGTINSGDNNHDLIHPTALFKYGLATRFELRLETDLITQYRQLVPNPETTTGFEPLAPGFRIGICEQKKIIPKTALITHVAIPTLASNAFKANHVAPDIVLAMENQITKNFGISYNTGAKWDGYSSSPYWLYSLSCGLKLGKNWESYIEILGSASVNSKAENAVDGGFGYYISNNVKLDAFAGFGTSQEAADYFLGFGFSFRIK
jgi:hypothetical protein